MDIKRQVRSWDRADGDQPGLVHSLSHGILNEISYRRSDQASTRASIAYVGSLMIGLLLLLLLGVGLYRQRGRTMLAEQRRARLDRAWRRAMGRSAGRASP